MKAHFDKSNKFHDQWKHYMLLFLVLSIHSSNFMNLLAQDQEYFDQGYDDTHERVMVDRMNQGIERFLTNYSEKIFEKREFKWKRDLTSLDAYESSIQENRLHLQEILGMVNPRETPELETVGVAGKGDILAFSQDFDVQRIRWKVLRGLIGEGLMLVPKGVIQSNVIIIPDADERPEMYIGLEPGNNLAAHLAASGVRVFLPYTISRDNYLSGGDSFVPRHQWNSNADSASVWTNLTHREWIHRQGYIMGRHIIGLEIEKILAILDFIEEENEDSSRATSGIMGYGEGGLLAMYAAALDNRVDVAWISGYFGPREKLWQEPVYRNIWGLLAEFGDAEIASLIAPRTLIIEGSPAPEITEPLVPKEGQRPFALPGKIVTPHSSEIEEEAKRMAGFFPATSKVKHDLKVFSETTTHGTREVLEVFCERLGIKLNEKKQFPVHYRHEVEAPSNIQERVFGNMVSFIQSMIPTADRTRYAFLKGDFSSPESWNQDMQAYRELFYEEFVGKIDHSMLPMNPKIREVYDEPGWKGYEVVLDVFPDVFSWGILAVPKDFRPDEKRPALVIQHGIGGVPTTSITGKTYHEVLPALVNRGFVVFSPYNPYQFNIRRANAIKLSAFSIIIPQHEQILNFLESLKYVDGSRIGFYGKSWGGMSAQTIPIVADRYKVIISSAYFNDWLKKAASVDYRNSYFFENSLSVYQWNAGNTFCHAEMALLIAPRPFMVESGYQDGVAPPEMVAYEFAKVKRIYDLMDIGDKVGLEFFNGGHVINGEGTFRFLHKHLDWPEPKIPTGAQRVKK